MSKGLPYLKKWGIGVNYCWSCWSPKLLLHFIEYRLNQLNRKHMKIAVNSAKRYFEGCCQKKCLLKVWSCLVYPSQKGVPVKFIICAKSDLPIKYSVFEKVWLTINGQSKMFLLSHKYFWSTHFWKWNGGTSIFFLNLHGYAFCFFIFFKMKETLQPPFWWYI